MANCPTDIAGFNKKKTELDNEYIGNNNSIITNSIGSIQVNIRDYVKGAGIGKQTQYDIAQQQFEKIVNGLKEYSNLNQCLTKHIKNIVTNDDVNNKLAKIGSLNTSITNLQKEIETSKHDLEVSRTRQKNIQESEKETTLYQGFSGKIGFIRPLKKTSVPVLIALGIVMILFTALLLKEFFAPTAGFAESLAYYNTSGVGSLFTQQRFMTAAAGFITTVIIVGVLAYKGYLGTSIH
jgi:hypothetical protein